MVTGLTLVLAVIFGAGDQYMGSLGSHGWGAWTDAASQMSATWLLLPFLAGMAQRSLRRGAGIGLIATYAGLLGYFVMTLSPLEGVSLAHVDIPQFLRSQADLLIGGALSGPAFGLFGARWRLKRTWWCPAVLAVCACLEPLVRAAANRLPPGTWVWSLEVAAGLAGALLIVTVHGRQRLNRSG